MSQFVDECNLHVAAGNGGAGCVAFRREAHVNRGGPSGGDGGRGGDVWLVAGTNVASLLAFRDHPHRRADHGNHGKGNQRHGKQGRDLLVPVPVGTVALSHDLREPLADLDAPGRRWLAAQAGAGGRGNARFLSNRRRAPTFAEQGEKGEQRWLRLELKLMADVAIIGFPNVGKSTFISRVSAAKPKIADYPFTTLEPNLGVARIDELTDLVLADIPGLIEGASEGRGLGHRFLRHTERARALLVLVDLAPWVEHSPAEQLAVLLNELENYRPELLERPRVVAGSRADLADPFAQPGDEASLMQHKVSAVTGEGIAAVMGALASLVAEARKAEPAAVDEVIHRPVTSEIEVIREPVEGDPAAPGGPWIVYGRAAVRAVALNDMTNPEALAYAQYRLRRLGVERELARAGARRGDVVRVGDFEFEYEPDDEFTIAPGRGR